MKRKEAASPAAEELRRQVTMETPSSMQRRPPEVPEQSPKSAAAWALSILCHQQHVPQHEPSPAVSSSYSQHPMSSTSYYPWQEYSPYDESPFVAKRLKVSHATTSPHFPEQSHVGMPPPPQYAPSPYHFHSNHAMQMYAEYSEPSRMFAPSMVTPTPKKHSYSRKNKSLGLLCENFIQTYRNCQVAISIDDAARALGVERRRIYDIINIFESLDIVARKCKNTYNWLGISSLPQVFGRLQEEALKEFAQDAVDHGLLQISVEKMPDRVPPQKKSLGRLSQQFLQLFLAGHPVMALTDASDKILGESSMEDLAALSKETNLLTPRQIQAAATRGLKTKIRRLYDIANVFVSLGLISKLETSSRKDKPTFQWIYPKSAKEIRDDYTKTAPPSATAASAGSMSSGTPISDTKLANLANINSEGARFPEPVCRTVSLSSSELKDV